MRRLATIDRRRFIGMAVGLLSLPLSALSRPWRPRVAEHGFFVLDEYGPAEYPDHVWIPKGCSKEAELILEHERPATQCCAGTR